MHGCTIRYKFSAVHYKCTEPVLQRSLLALREMDVTVSSVKISVLPRLEEESLVLSVQVKIPHPVTVQSHEIIILFPVQLQTDEKGAGQKMNKKKKQELYHNLHNLSDENELEVTNLAFYFGLSLVESNYMIWILATHWSIVIT